MVSEANLKRDWCVLSYVDGMTPRGGIESEASGAALSRRMIVTASGLTLLTAVAGKAAASAGGPSSGGQSAAGELSRSASARGRVPGQRLPGGSGASGGSGLPSGGSEPAGGGTQGSAGGSPSGGGPTSPSQAGQATGSPSGTPTSPPSSRTPATTQPQFYVHGGDKAIALTIDDGPDGRYTPQVLALLAQYKISATFCMLGSAAKTHAGLVQEVVAAGHQIGNHTFSHANLSKMAVAAVRGEITRANDALAGAGARPPTFFRAPFGVWSPAVFQVCDELGLKPLDWSVDPRDWSRPGTDQIVSTVLSRTHTGSIILEHDGGGDRSQTVAALARFLPQLLEAGYRFVQP